MRERKYTGLSKDEIYLISRLEFEKERLITTHFARKLFPNSNKASKVISSLLRKRRIICLEKGKYLPIPLKAPNQQWFPNEFVVADLWMGEIPYYIGYFTMYNYWGFTEQVPQTVFVLNTKKSCKKVIGNVRYQAVKIDQKKYYGIEKIRIDEAKVCISDKERTLVDFIYNPIGSFENIETVLRDNIKKINLDKFIRYLKQFPVVSVRKRAGFLLEKLGCNALFLSKLKKTIGNKQTYIVLNPTNKSRKGKVNKEWRIIVNR